MQINADLIKAERERRAWSQEHLATAAGVGLRTIQRVEASGIASNETAKALASVFECQVHDLVVEARSKPVATIWKNRYSFAASAAMLMLSIVFVANRAGAGEIMLDIVLELSTQDTKVFKLITKDGQSIEASVDNQLRIVMVPTLMDNDLILLTTEVYEFKGGSYSLLSKPRVLTRTGVDAKIQMAMEGGRAIDVNIRPTKIWRAAIGS